MGHEFKSKNELERFIDVTDVNTGSFQRELHNKKYAFLLKSYESMYNDVMAGIRCNTPLNCHDLITTKHKKLKLFIDYDRKPSKIGDVRSAVNAGNDALVSVLHESHKNEIVGIVNAIKDAVPTKQVDNDTVHILKSVPNVEKKSYHIIIESLVFKTIDAMKKFVEDTLKPIFPDLFTESIIDTQVYKPGGLRLLGCVKIGSDRILHLLDTAQFLSTYTEKIIPFSKITLEQFKACSITSIDPKYEPFAYRRQAQRPQQAKIHMSDEDIYEEHEVVQRYVDLLDPSRYTERNKWLNVGYILHSINPNFDKIWHNFSQKWDKYTHRDAQIAWESFANGEIIYTINNLIHLARIDNPDGLEEVCGDIVTHDMQYLKPFDNVLSKLVKRLYGEYFVCSNPEKNEWYRFTSSRWIRENKCLMLRKLISDEVFNKVDKYRQQLIKQQAPEESIKLYYNIEKLIGTGIRISALELEFYNESFSKIIDQNRDILGFNNGILNLRTGEFRSGVPSDYVSMTTGYEYVATPPDDDMRKETEKLIEKIFPDKEVRDFVMMTLASTLDGYVRDERFYVWIGTGANGKSTIADLHKKALGDYAITGQTTLVTKQRESANNANSALMSLRNKRFVELQEPDVRETLQAGVIKSLTGGDDVSGRELFSSQSSFKPHAKIFLCCNNVPTITGVDGGVMRRILIVNFVSRFVENAVATETQPYVYERDNELKNKFEKMKMPYMSILIDYYKRYREEGLHVPECVQAVTRRYETNNNIIKQFVDDYLIRSKTGVLSRDELKEIFISDDTLRTSFDRRFNKFIQQLEYHLNEHFETNSKMQVVLKGFSIKPALTDDSENECE